VSILSSIVALGFFDGIHIGHAALLRETVSIAAKHGAVPAAITFDRPPSGAPCITGVATRRMLTERCGIKNIHVLAFDRVKDMPPGDFLERIVIGELDASAVTAGPDFRFGAGARGDTEFLQQYMRSRGREVHLFKKIKRNGQAVSSTTIRACIERSDMPSANALLGYPYTVYGEVLHGRRLGRTLGWPTANLALDPRICAPHGVYASRAVLPDGRVFNALANIGRRPTVNDGESMPNLEAHLLDYDGDLYGCMLEIKLYEYIRPERAFGGIDELQSQISRDKEDVEQVLAGII